MLKMTTSESKAGCGFPNADWKILIPIGVGEKYGVTIFHFFNPFFAFRVEVVRFRTTVVKIDY